MLISRRNFRNQELFKESTFVTNINAYGSGGNNQKLSKQKISGGLLQTRMNSSSIVYNTAACFACTFLTKYL